ncbi:MAG: hypothetical protein Q8R90_01535 [Bacteroidales bacterium]|nr:hypothetical protein [Bacteroidales bacterium]
MRSFSLFFLWSLISLFSSVFTVNPQERRPTSTTNKSPAGGEYMQIPTTVKSLLPKEFCSPLSGDNALVIGVSDPGRDSVTGRREALLRAYIVASLRERVKVSMVSDYFTSAGAKSSLVVSRYEEMYYIESELSREVSLRPLSSYTLSSGETILFAEVIRGNNSKESAKSIYRFECSLYHIENTLERGQHVYKTKYRFYPQKGGLKMQDREDFEVYSINNLWYTVSGEFNGEVSARENSKYFYATQRSSQEQVAANDGAVGAAIDGAVGAAPDGAIGVSTVEGLWPAYVSALLWQIAGVLDYGNPTVSQVTDSHKNRIRNLSRSAECNFVKAEVLKLTLFKERLYPVVKIDQLNPGER